MPVAVPPIFLGVSAFLLYITMINRIVQAEREEIGLLKAFGYSDTGRSRDRITSS